MVSVLHGFDRVSELDQLAGGEELAAPAAV
jgi:hypothetical protein